MNVWCPSLALLVGAIACTPASTDQPGGDPVGDEQDISTAPSADEAKACESTTVGKDGTGAAVVHCVKPFTTAPFVRLPPDAITPTTASFYGGITVPSTFDELPTFWSRDGKRYVAVDASGQALKFATDARKLPKSLHAPTNRVTFTLYQFTGTLGAAMTTPYGPATAIQLTAARPVVEIDGCAFDSRLAGTWSGTVSQRLETPAGSGAWAKAFDPAVRIPIHLTLKTLTKGTLLTEYKGGAPIADADTFMLSGTIDNFAADVTVGKTTYPSLKAMGNKNPFLGAKDGVIQLYRLGNMHGLMNDGHWVMSYPSGSQALSTTGMSNTLTALTAPSMLLDKGVSADSLTSIAIQPHIPFASNGHTVVITPENVGGQSGQCH